MITVVTVVVWNEGWKHVKPVGPTSSGADLGYTLHRARDLYDHATIVPWDLHDATPAEVLEHRGGEE